MARDEWQELGSFIAENARAMYEANCRDCPYRYDCVIDTKCYLLIECRRKHEKGKLTWKVFLSLVQD